MAGPLSLTPADIQERMLSHLAQADAAYAAGVRAAIERRLAR